MVFPQLVFLVLITIAAGQALIDQTRGNECRHTCILSRNGPKSRRSTHCQVPVQAMPREELTLKEALDSQSQWTLNHKGSINAQLVYFDNTPENRAVWFLSQKSCFDYGDARGFPVSTMFQNVSTGPGSKNPALMGDWASNPEHGDIFKGCIEHTTPWTNAVLKTSASDKGSHVPPEAARYMRVHAGKHEGGGSFLKPYEFAYDASQLEGVFQRALNEAESKSPSIPDRIAVTNLDDMFLRNLTAAARKATIENRSIPGELTALQRNKPLLLRGFPFDNGLSIITDEKINSSKPRPDLVLDIEWLAWNRLQESVASLAAGPAPKVLLPDVIKHSDMLYITVLAVTSFFGFVYALRTIEQTSRERVLRWRRPASGHRWTFATHTADHDQLEQYMATVSPDDTKNAVVTLIVVFVVIVGAVLTFWNSDIRYSKIMILRQGYIVTYGPSNPKKWAVRTPTGQSNANAGARFIVGVWLKAQFESVGKPSVIEVITVVYVFLGLALLHSSYKFSILRVSQLTWPRYRKVVQHVRAVIQAVTGGLARLPLVNRLVTSYLSEYRRNVHDLAKDFDHPGFTERVNWSGEWVRSLNLEQRDTPESVPPLHPNETHIERAAAFLAGDKFGRLSIPQILALLWNPDLVDAVDLYHRRRRRLSIEQVVCLSRLYTINGVLVPEPRPGQPHDEFYITSNDTDLWNETSAALLSVPEGYTDAPHALPRFAVVQSE